jgi:hypothetical protein
MAHFGFMIRFRKLVGWIFKVSILAVVSGILLNAYVMHLNGGVMPVLLTNSTADRAFYQRELAEGGSHGMTGHALATPRTKWVWAVDRFRRIETAYDDNDRPLGEQVMGIASVGDIVAIYGFGSIFLCCLAGLYFLFDDPWFFCRR